MTKTLQTSRFFTILSLVTALFLMACTTATVSPTAPTQIVQSTAVPPTVILSTELPATAPPTSATPTAVPTTTLLAVPTHTSQPTPVPPTTIPTAALEESLEKALVGRWNCQSVTIDDETTGCPDYEYPIEITNAGTFLGAGSATWNAFTPPHLLNAQGLHGEINFQVELSGDALTLERIDSSIPKVTTQYSRITSGIPDIESPIVGQWECQSVTIDSQTNSCPESQSVIEFTNTGVFIAVPFAEPYSISPPNVLILARLDGTGSFQVEPSGDVLTLTVDNPSRASQIIAKFSRIK